MKKQSVRLLFVTLLFVNTCFFSQASNIDSLINQLDHLANAEKIDLLLKIGDELKYSAPDSAIMFYEAALDEAVGQNNNLYKGHAFKKLGNINLFLGNFDLTNTYYQKALEIYDTENDLEGVANIYNNMGSVPLKQGNFDEAIEYFKKGLDLRKEIGDMKGVAGSYNNIGLIYLNKGQYELAVENIEKSLEIKTDLNDTIGIINCYFNLGMICSDQSDYDKALEYYSDFLKVAESQKDENAMADCYNNIGGVYFHMGNYEKSTVYYQKALSYKEKLGNKKDVALCYINLGNLQFEQQNHEKSLEYYTKGLNISESINDNSTTSTCFINMGNIYQETGKMEFAKEHYLKALQLKEQSGDLNGVGACYASLASIYYEQNQNDEAIYYYEKATGIKKQTGDLKGLSLIYINLSALYYTNNDFTKSLGYAEKASEISKEIKALPEQVKALEKIANANFKLKRYKEAANYLYYYIESKDSLIGIRKMMELENLEAKYQTEKKEQQIQLQEIQIKQQHDSLLMEQALSQKKQQQIIFLIAGIALLFILGIFVYRGYRQKKKANNILEEKNEQINFQNEQINEKNEELFQLVEEVTTQKEEIEKQKNRVEIIHEDLTQSIDYAKRIQTSTLPDSKLLKQKFSGHFIFFKPRDVVSGDFYWWATVEKKSIIAVADCTGHGVPGAFMSMLGMSLLKEIVVKEYITHPGVILRKLRKEVINVLKQKDDSDTVNLDGAASMKVNDGMDMSLISIDHEAGTIQFAGANNPLYLIRNNELTEIKGDKMPISIYVKMDKFNTHEMTIHKGDQLYMFSDGYADQFGGPQGKKFKYKPFKELLKNNSKESMSVQKDILENIFNEWKGNIDQIDDVMVVGIKI